RPPRARPARGTGSSRVPPGRAPVAVGRPDSQAEVPRRHLVWPQRLQLAGRPLDPRSEPLQSREWEPRRRPGDGDGPDHAAPMDDGGRDRASSLVELAVGDGVAVATDGAQPCEETRARRYRARRDTREALAAQ